MRFALILAIAFAAALPGCKSSKQPQNMEQMKKRVPDAKPTLHVAEDDPRYVAAPGETARQVHYYSPKTDTTYVVDESTGKVVTTFKSKKMPGVLVIDRPAYQPPPLKTEPPAESTPKKEGCGEGCAPSEEGCGCGMTDIEEVEGCGCAPEGCGCAPEGCDEGCGCGCE